MSNFAKKGLREMKQREQKNIKEGFKSWMIKYNQILKIKDMLISDQSINTSTLTEDNINTYVKPLFGRDLDNMEKLIVLGNLHDYEQGNK